MLTSVLPPSACASCRLCCNFSRPSAWETPALEPEVAEHLRALGIPLVERNGAMTIALEFATENPQECALCPLLNTKSGCTLPREQRPLECRLWPLRLMRGEQGELLLTCYTACPGLASVPRKRLLELADSLRSLLFAHARRCPASVRPLHPNYAPLCRLA